MEEQMMSRPDDRGERAGQPPPPPLPPPGTEPPDPFEPSEPSTLNDPADPLGPTDPTDPFGPIWAPGPRPRNQLPRPAASSGAAVTAAGAGLAASLAVQSRPASIATFLAVVVTAGAVAAVPSRRRLEHAVPLVLAVGAGALVVLRASPWVVWPAMAVAAWGLVVGGQGRLIRRGRPGVASWLIDDARLVVPWLIDPFTPAEMGGTTSRRFLRGLVVTVAALVPLTWLLTSADAAFAELLHTVVGGDALDHIVLTAVLTPVLAIPMIASRRTDRLLDPGRTRSSTGSMLEVTMVLGGVATVLGGWTATQLAVALGGAERLLATADLTAAEHARSGFFQLVAATGLLVVIVVGADRLVERREPQARRRFLLLTAIIGVETVGLVFATYGRLALYVQGFGQTMLRLSAAWFLAWLLVAMVLVVIAVNRPGDGLGPARTALTVLAAVWVLTFGLNNPEGAVAARNLDRQATAGLDASYVARDLGADAVPTIVERIDRQPSEVRQQLRQALCARFAEPTDVGLAGWNRSIDVASRSISILDCPTP